MIALHKEDPVSVDVGYNLIEAAYPKKLNGHLNIQYARDKNIKSGLLIVRPNENEYKVDFHLDTPQVPGTRLEVNTKKSNDGKIINSEVVLTADSKRFILSNELILSDISPAFDVKLVLPNGKVDRIYAKLNRHSPKHFGGELKVNIIKVA